MSGWIKKHRKIMTHWLYEEERVFSRYEAFDYLLMTVNHQDNKVMMDGKLVDVERGKTITSVRKLCERWKWSNTKVVQFLEALELDGIIEKKSDTKKTVISIVNYGKYQGSDVEETTQERHRNDTETIQKHTNKNVKKEKNVKNEQEIKEIDKKEYAPKVALSDDEYQKLILKYGNEILVIQAIDKLSNYKCSKKTKYTSDYHVLIGWVFDDFEKKHLIVLQGGASNAQSNGQAGRTTYNRTNQGAGRTPSISDDELNELLTVNGLQ